MRAVIKRVKSARLFVDDNLISEIGIGLVVYVGVCLGDTTLQAEKLAQKIASIRIFEENDKMNLNVQNVNGSVLLVSNFTLCTKEGSGTRPDFTLSADKTTANELYLLVAQKLNELGVPTKTGVFGADMQIMVHEDGPITIYKEIL